MSKLHARMVEDQYLRDSARALVEADVQNLRNCLNSRSIAARAADRLKDGALDVYDEAVSVASDNKGVLAAFVAALALWLMRNPLISLFSSDAGGKDDEPGDDDAEGDFQTEP